MSALDDCLATAAGSGPADLEMVLAAWHDATLRLEKTHEALQGEVRRLTEELEIKNRELARKNRLADLGQMASHVAHEVRNSLVPVKLYLSLLRRRVAGDAASLDVLGKVESGFLALETTVSDLLQFTSDRDPQRVRFDLATLADEIFAALAPQLAAQSIQCENRVPPATGIFADRNMLRRALLNLVLNAIEALPGGGTIAVAARAAADGIELEVADTGKGLSDDTLKRAFEPFFTTKSEGTGLGLAIVYRIAEVHGGAVAARNASQGGAVFTLCLPQTCQETAT